MHTYTARAPIKGRSLRNSRFLVSALFVAFVFPPQAYSRGIDTASIDGTRFLLNGKSFQIIAGEMHYPRVPREYWRDRFRKARAMGLNTITTYAFWNVNEPRPGVFDFSGQNDVAEYIREAQQEGLYVILRPGPYICGEWEFGGYPSWLLKNQELMLRADDPKYLSAVQTWFDRLGKEVHPLLLQNGGPIIAIQIENEYGSFGDDHKYMQKQKEAFQKSGMNAEVLYTADSPDLLANGSLPGLPAVINFGSGDAAKSFQIQEHSSPEGLRMVGEYWDGWFDHWGGRHHVSNAEQQADELAWMLRRGYSVNLYMFHGGTNFGWMNGANSDGTDFRPDTTSYDYDAPLDEKGAPRRKYFLFRDAISKSTGVPVPTVSFQDPVVTFDFAPGIESASLWRNLPTPVRSKTLLTMEDIGQSYGYILYRTGLDEGDGGELVIDGLHDYAQIYINQEMIGSLDRRLGTNRISLPILRSAGTLDILVENSGRLNYTAAIRGERKGIVGSVTIGGKTPTDWEIYSLPMDRLSQIRFLSEACSGPCFYRTKMLVPKTEDTFFDTRALHKGQLWVNDRPLGRFWSIGPQFSLFVPGPWLQKGDNAVVFFDLNGDYTDHVKTVGEPIFGETTEVRD